MIICHCKKVTDKEIKNQVKNGFSSLEEIKKSCNACTGCGGCEYEVTRIIKKEIKNITTL